MRFSGVVTVGGRPAGPGTLRWASGEGGSDGVIFNVQSALGGVRQQILGAGRSDVEAVLTTAPSRSRGSRRVAIRAAGWELGALLLRLGVLPAVEPDLPLVLAGLPAGAYQVALGDVVREAAVEAGDLARVELP